MTISFKRIAASVIASSICFTGIADSLTTSSSASSVSVPKNKNNNENENSGITEAMHAAATAETERIYRFYRNDSDDDEDGGGSASSSSSSSSPPTVWRSREEAASYVREEIDTVLFDCDGVLYRTATPCPGAIGCVRDLMVKQNKTVLFVTNNAGVNRRELRDKLSKLLRFDDLTMEQMVSSSYASARYLAGAFEGDDDDDGDGEGRKNEKKKKKRRRVHVIGSSGLCEELRAAGFDVTGGPQPETTPGGMSRDELGAFDFENDDESGGGERLHPIDALVVGHDTDLSFRKLCVADNLLLRNPNALFVATNLDSFDVVDGRSGGESDDARHILGNGATVVALEYSSKRKAINVGKPSRTLFDLIRWETTTAIAGDDDDDDDGPLKDPSRCLFVGDRLDTDIRFGRDNGMKSLLVMTGVTDAKALEELGMRGTSEEPLPDFVLPHVGMMV
eukprot:CAMPEP_0197177800 /NCGR_PEP_ID=MMETSP1423-20130617/3277_1 /TAXON_ID=476441 /ORGANISM="Pseudo-nitzschia heimii, Strain UNC1101" /LENGTH=449 /DNA_ID=CAMNT_0042627407 /DNA_START=37 /DNA_END=1386 /DNA_ORIENTATION=-